MDEETAPIIFAAIMTAGFVVWLWSLAKALHMGARPAETDWRLLAEEQTAPRDIESGARTVRGDPEKLSKALARSLTQVNIGAFGSLFEITERTTDRIALKKTGPLMCNQPAGLYFSEAEIKFEDLGNHTTRVSYVLGFDRLTRRLKTVALLIILGIGLPVMLLVGAAIWFLVLPSDDPAVRWQVLQTLQIVHGLWPPFLIMGVYSLGRKQARTYFSNLLSTLELAE